MSYARWGHSSDFYAYWNIAESGNKKEDQGLSLCHVSHMERDFCITYLECVRILASSDFNSIPGNADEYEASLRNIIVRFIQDVDSDEKFCD